MKIYRSVHPPAAANYEMIQRDQCRTKVSVFWWGSCLLLRCGLPYNATGSCSIVVIQTGSKSSWSGVRARIYAGLLLSLSKNSACSTIAEQGRGSAGAIVAEGEISFSLGASEISGSMIIGAGGILCSVKSVQPESGFLPGVSDLRSESSPWPPPLVGDSALDILAPTGRAFTRTNQSFGTLVKGWIVLVHRKGSNAR